MSGLLGTVGSLASNAIGPISEALLVGLPNSFSTKNAQLPPPLYALALRFPSPPYIPLFLYTFPISPANIRKEFTAMTNVYDVIGPSQNFGVTRIPDVYGKSPPTWLIEGTTGQKYHQTDGGLFTGLESILIMQGVLSQYFSLNAQRAATGNANQLYRLEFYDYYTSDFYEIVPIGPQIIRQDAQRPSLLYYRLRLAGIQSLAQPISNLIDPIFNTFTTSVNQVQQTVGANIGSFVSEYV